MKLTSVQRTVTAIAFWLVAQSLTPFDAHAVQSVEEPDSLAMVALYESTDGDNWHNNANWFEAPVSEWYGIERVDNEGRIERLDLSENNLNGTIPSEIGKFVFIERILLEGNRLTGDLPETLTDLNNLRRLDVSDNLYEIEIPAWINRIETLERLMMSNNRIYGEIVDLSNAERLEYLELDGNRLTGEVPEWITRMNHLQRLVVSDNRLTGEIPDLSGLPRLERLELSGNELSGPMPEWFGDFNSIVELRVSDIPFEPGPMPDLSDLFRLEDLRMANTNRTGELPDWLAELINLQRLELNDNQLTGTLPDAVFQFIDLDDLEVLDLADNHFIGEMPEWVTQLENGDALKINEPVGIYLTWQRDPTTTMTIDWHTTPDDEAIAGLVYKKMGDEEWIEVDTELHEFPHTDRTIHRVELTGLDPSTYYRFRMGEFERTYKFRTMPEDLSEPVRFMAGGDTDHSRHRMSGMAMNFDPDFIVWGGDLAYEDADPVRVDRLFSWFDGMRENLISEDGRVVPILVALGNHEYFQKRRLREGDGPHHQHTREEALEFMEHHGLEEGEITFFFDVYAFPGSPGYNVLDFGDYLSMVILDTGNHSPIDGEQTEWLAEVLSERVDRPHVFPVHHHGGYPSQRDYQGGNHTRIRENWFPLYEEHGVRVAFENHDHAYKRTYPIINEEVKANGVVYIGDGAWGVNPRDRECCSDAWYIQEFASKRHGIVVTLHGAHQHFLMVDEYGNIIDEYPERPRPQTR